MVSAWPMAPCQSPAGRVVGHAHREDPKETARFPQIAPRIRRSPAEQPQVASVAPAEANRCPRAVWLLRRVAAGSMPKPGRSGVRPRARSASWPASCVHGTAPGEATQPGLRPGAHLRFFLLWDIWDIAGGGPAEASVLPSRGGSGRGRASTNTGSRARPSRQVMVSLLSLV
jgi:hypothetical protein